MPPSVLGPERGGIMTRGTGRDPKITVEEAIAFLRQPGPCGGGHYLHVPDGRNLPKGVVNLRELVPPPTRRRGPRT